MTTTRVPGRVSGRATAVGVAVVVVAFLTGCVDSNPVSTATPTRAPGAASTPTPTANPSSELRPDGNAAANKPFFDSVNTEFNAANGMSDGRSIIDNLVSKGFVKADMEVTYDTTALEIPVDLIVFSVRIKGDCLIGQFDATGYTSLQAPLLGTGTCLVGVSRPIDW